MKNQVVIDENIMVNLSKTIKNMNGYSGRIRTYFCDRKKNLK